MLQLTGVTILCPLFSGAVPEDASPTSVQGEKLEGREAGQDELGARVSMFWSSSTLQVSRARGLEVLL